MRLRFNSGKGTGPFCSGCLEDKEKAKKQEEFDQAEEQAAEEFQKALEAAEAKKINDEINTLVKEAKKGGNPTIFTEDNMQQLKASDNKLKGPDNKETAKRKKAFHKRWIEGASASTVEEFAWQREFLNS